MNLIRRTATAAVAALALSVPTAAVTAANAAPTGPAGPAGVSQTEQHDGLAKKPKKQKKKLKVKLQTSAKYSHVGQAGVKVTAIVTKGKKKAKGKVAFSLNGAPAATVKLKKGKASYQLASSNAPGSYQVSAKYKSKKKSTSIRVYSSAISLSATTFTISAAADSWDLPTLTGSVQFKDAPATQGYVDIYQNGNIKGGSSSPDYCCMASIGDGGTFEFSSYSFLGRVQDKGPGTYTFQAFYTDGPAFADYIYSTPIQVIVTP